VIRLRFPSPVVLAVLVLAAAACGLPTSTSTAPTAFEPASTPVAVATGVETPTPATPGPSSAPTASSAPGLVVDADLLRILPATVDGIAMVPDPDTAATLVGNRELTATASGLAMARYVAADAASGDDLAVVSVVQLRPGVFGEPFYEAWRADYDGSACDAAGGATGTSEEAIGAFAVQVGTCAQGARTYHLHLDGDVLVSILAVGPRELGVGVIEGLRP
jgi:hypothetical protein